MANPPTVKVTVKVDTTKLRRLVQVVEAAIPKVVRKSAERAQAFWISEAGRRLNSSSWKYIEAINIAPGTKNSYKVFLHHPDAKINEFLLRLERGMHGAQIDMKPMLLKGRAYRVVPLWLESGKHPVVFRTVSINSPKDSWMWPKKDKPSIVVQGLQLQDRVIEEVDDRIVDEVVDEMLREAGF